MRCLFQFQNKIRHIGDRERHSLLITTYLFNLHALFKKGTKQVFSSYQQLMKISSSTAKASRIPCKERSFAKTNVMVRCSPFSKS